MSQSTLNKIIVGFLIVGTLAQFFLKLSGSAGIFRYGFMWLCLYSRFMFSCSLLGKQSLYHLQIDAFAFGMSIVLFMNITLSKGLGLNTFSAATVVIIELIILLIYKLCSKFVYVFEVRKVD